MAERAFVLGLDGVPWRLIEQWVEEGELPNFARLVDEGAAGPLESTTPATTPVAWPSIATGVRADEHGLYEFQRLTSDYSHEMNTSADVGAPAIWELVGPSIVGNVPMTYPAAEIDGTMVAGMLSPAIDEQFTHPPGFAETIRAEIPDYRISLQWGEYADDREAFRREFDWLVAARRELMALLIERAADPELFFFVYTAPDRLQHLFWREDVMLEHYRELDEILGEVCEYVADAGRNLFVVSDHGFGPTERKVHVNRLLADAGLLAENDLSGTRGVLGRLGVRRDDVADGLARLGVDESAIVDRLPRVLVDRVAEQVPGTHPLYDVDFPRTKAFLHLSGAIYVNDAERFDEGIVQPGAVPDVKREVADVLAAATDPETGEAPLAVHDGDDLFPTDDHSPDLVVAADAPYAPYNDLATAAFADADDRAAGHRPEGIFLAWGPSIEPGAAPDGAAVYDLAPTVLHTLGRPVPERADGRVLGEIFAPDSRASGVSVERAAYGDAGGAASVEDDFENVEERLRGLGYL